MDQAGTPLHHPVMVNEVCELLRDVPAPGVLVDATFGAGGHARALRRLLPTVSILAIDRDPAAASAADAPVTFVEGNFIDLEEILAAEGVDEISGVLFDLGVSSPQLDDPARGFSYRASGPVDMRMGREADVEASAIVNEWPATDLTRLLKRYGEERHARRIAEAIVRARPIQDTLSLASVVAEAVPAPARRYGHPARRTFQAIRIAVNDELTALAAGLDAAIAALRIRGRIAVISYHSLEDRIVKRRFARGAAGCQCPPGLPECGCGQSSELRLLTRKPLRPTQREIEENHRARSARLRGAEKVAVSR